MTATPAVECGTNTFSSPSPPVSATNSAHCGVMSTTLSVPPVRSSSNVVRMRQRVPRFGPVGTSFPAAAREAGGGEDRSGTGPLPGKETILTPAAANGLARRTAGEPVGNGPRLGPVLRNVTETSATIWVETTAPGRVTVTAGDLSASADTFEVHGHHYALCDLTGLRPGQAVEYRVSVDGAPVWPEADSPHPPSL